jgi:hypothetical protein
MVTIRQNRNSGTGTKDRVIPIGDRVAAWVEQLVPRPRGNPSRNSDLQTYSLHVLWHDHALAELDPNARARNGSPWTP